MWMKIHFDNVHSERGELRESEASVCNRFPPERDPENNLEADPEEDPNTDLMDPVNQA